MKRNLVIPIVLAALFCGPVSASKNKGWVYDGLTGGSSASEDGLSDNSFGSNSSLGYRWGKLGVEVGHVFFGAFRDRSVIGGTGVNVDSKVDGWNVGVNATHDFGHKWSAQGRVGVFDWHDDGHVLVGASRVRFSDRGNDWYAGVSLDHQWRDSSSLGFGYTYFKAGNARIGLWGLHTEHHF